VCSAKAQVRNTSEISSFLLSFASFSQKHDFLPLAQSLAKDEDFKHIEELYIPFALIFSFTKLTFLKS